VLADLRELIDIIDRRAPYLEPERERRIGLEAAVLRRQAEDRIAEIEASLAAAS
jgi:hypothetical protein